MLEPLKFPDIQKLLVGLVLKFSFLKPSYTNLIWVGLNYVVGWAVTIIVIYPKCELSLAIFFLSTSKCRM